MYLSTFVSVYPCIHIKSGNIFFNERIKQNMFHSPVYVGHLKNCTHIEHYLTQRVTHTIRNRSHKNIREESQKSDCTKQQPTNKTPVQST
jgi:hypothetical protein